MESVCYDKSIRLEAMAIGCLPEFAGERIVTPDVWGRLEADRRQTQEDDLERI